MIIRYRRVARRALCDTGGFQQIRQQRAEMADILRTALRCTDNTAVSTAEMRARRNGQCFAVIIIKMDIIMILAGDGFIDAER